jgi:hypothetical protein
MMSEDSESKEKTSPALVLLYKPFFLEYIAPQSYHNPSPKSTKSVARQISAISAVSKPRSLTPSAGDSQHQGVYG